VQHAVVAWIEILAPGVRLGAEAVGDAAGLVAAAGAEAEGAAVKEAAALTVAMAVGVRVGAAPRLAVAVDVASRRADEEAAELVG
jgi:hypothetical protein